MIRLLAAYVPDRVDALIVERGLIPLVDAFRDDPVGRDLSLVEG